MKLLIALLFIGITSISFAQPRDLTPNKRSKAFGKRDFRNLGSTGLQVSLGPTFMVSPSKIRSFNLDPSVVHLGESYTHSSAGLPGFMVEIGLAHFPKKRSKLSLALKTVLVSYFDWGIGYKHLGGAETTTIRLINGQEIENSGSFYNGHVYGRFTLHKNINLDKKNKRFYLDNGLGINIDYRVLNGTSNYIGEVDAGERSQYGNLVVQLHYSLGLGIKLKRGMYLIPALRAPLVGFQQTTGSTGKPKNFFGNPSLQWFSSNYWPLYPHIKLMYFFEKKVKGCKGADVNDQDRETQRNR